MNVLSTRGMGGEMPATLAVLKGIAADGGLFVPERFPQINIDELMQYANDYDLLAANVMGLYFDMPEERMQNITHQAYQTFDTDKVVPVCALSDKDFVMELTHGPTLAFKDMALQVLPRLIETSLEIHDQPENVLILTATSGDTGKAALEGFKDVPRTGIVVFYPVDGVATMQKLQMTTQEGNNVSVCAVRGNFDDAQTGVKELFASEKLKEELAQAGYSFSSANSINIGRLIPQVAYYVYTYIRLVSDGKIQNGEEINFVVPTGNFGNILAAYYAKRMGLPIKKLICASNKNNVLTDFFHYGDYNANRTFHKTSSPSMDILISSNLERLLFELCGRDAQQVTAWMNELKETGKYRITPEMRTQLDSLFWADQCTEEETANAIAQTFEEYGYLIDTHTAVAQCALQKYKAQTGDDAVSVVVSTANPYKFTQDVLKAVTGEDVSDAFEAADRLSAATGTCIPPQISDLKWKPILHTGVTDKNDLMPAVEQFLDKMGN